MQFTINRNLISMRLSKLMMTQKNKQFLIKNRQNKMRLKSSSRKQREQLSRKNNIRNWSRKRKRECMVKKALMQQARKKRENKEKVVHHLREFLVKRRSHNQVIRNTMMKEMRCLKSKCRKVCRCEQWSKLMINYS